MCVCEYSTVAGCSTVMHNTTQRLVQTICLWFLDSSHSLPRPLKARRAHMATVSFPLPTGVVYRLAFPLVPCVGVSTSSRSYSRATSSSGRPPCCRCCCGPFRSGPFRMVLVEWTWPSSKWLKPCFPGVLSTTRVLRKVLGKTIVMELLCRSNECGCCYI